MSTEKAPRSFSTGTYGVNMRSVKEAKIIIPRCYTQTWPTLFAIPCKLIRHCYEDKHQIVFKTKQQLTQNSKQGKSGHIDFHVTSGTLFTF